MPNNSKTNYLTQEKLARRTKKNRLFLAAVKFAVCQGSQIGPLGEGWQLVLMLSE